MAVNGISDSGSALCEQNSSDGRKTKKGLKVALITGITGQDGSYLAEFLLDKHYVVHGLIRRSSLFNTARIDHLYRDRNDRMVEKDPDDKKSCLHLHYGDMTDSQFISKLVGRIKPDELYNLAAQSHVRVSFEIPQYTTQVCAVGTLSVLQAIIECELVGKTRLYQASSSEMYGEVKEIPQTETTPFNPRSPYAISKLFSYWTVINHRMAYNLHASNGILFNHESPRRGATFVTRKITRAVAKISLGKLDCLYLGNLNSVRDWGHAKEYVQMMWIILQQESPDDYVISTGETHSVREFVEKAFAVVGIKIRWEGEELNEVGIDDKTDQILVRIDEKYFRPTEVDLLKGDSSKAKRILGWNYKFSFDNLVQEMVESDLEMAKAGAFKY